MRNCRDPVRTQYHATTRPNWCGGCRRVWRAWLRCPWAVAGPDRATHSDTAPPVWRAPEGPEGTGGLRDRPLRAKLACGDLAGGRARRRPEHQRSTLSSPASGRAGPAAVGDLAELSTAGSAAGQSAPYSPPTPGSGRPVKLTKRAMSPWKRAVTVAVAPARCLATMMSASPGRSSLS